jgi:hypothetical protein
VSDFVVNSIQFDEDGVATITYLQRSEALRDAGNLFRTQTLSISPESSLAPDVADLLASVVDLLLEATQVYRDMPAWLPTEDETDEDDLEDRGMGF